MSQPGSSIETSVRQLIANGKSKTALDSAKEFHKAQGSAASELLLIDAYIARIQSLADQNFVLEAKALIGVVRERFPSAGPQLDALNATSSAQGGDLDGLLGPLNDPELSAERRAAIEQWIQNQMADPAALAGCVVLPREHSLRQAAAAIDKAFRAVTSGPVTDEQIALAEVSHRSPLGPWKLLIRAIACFYRDQDQACGECLAAIKPESVPSRAVPAMRAMLGAKPAPTLKPACAALVSRTSVSLAKLRGALANIDDALEQREAPGRIFKVIRDAVRECRLSAPDLLTRARQMVSIMGEIAGLDPTRTFAALEGAPRADAFYFRALACAMERTGDPTALREACLRWDDFRREAIREDWFAESSVESATLYLHMAGLLERIPREFLRTMQGTGHKRINGEDNYFLFPLQLYERACLMDPHPDAFSQWLRHARRVSVSEAEGVARAWNKACPGDTEPLLYLMKEAEKRNAFPTALSYLDKAERIDSVHPVVRAARRRLLAAAAMRHLQQKKPHLAAEKLAALTALPQSSQGDAPAFYAVLRHLVCLARGDSPGASEARLEAERILGDNITGGMLIFGIAAVSKISGYAVLPLPRELTDQERSRIPACMARVLVLTKDLGIRKFQLPVPYFREMEAQFPRVSGSLDVEQIRSLGELGIATEYLGIAWAASRAGLERGGSTEAYFLLLRARALPEGWGDRYDVLTAAAAELGRFYRDMEVVDNAVESGRTPFDDLVSLTLDQAREVVRKEKAAPAFPSRYNSGPDYSDFLPSDSGLDEPCQCPECRSSRGESPDPADSFEIDDAEMERIFNERVPKDLPPELSRALLEVMKGAFKNGESPDQIMSRVAGIEKGLAAAKKKKKGRRT